MEQYSISAKKPNTRHMKINKSILANVIEIKSYITSKTYIALSQMFNLRIVFSLS